MAEFVPRPEYEEAVRRLDAADLRLEEALHNLRRELEDKISNSVRDLKADLRADILDVKSGLSDELLAINDRLSWQNKVWVVPVVTAVTSIIVFLFMHYVFHIPSTELNHILPHTHT